MEHATPLSWAAARGETPAGVKENQQQIGHSNDLTGDCTNFSNTAFAPQILKVIRPGSIHNSSISGRKGSEVAKFILPLQILRQRVLVCLAFQWGALIN